MKVNDENNGSGSKSGSVSKRHGSADPDPHQNVMDPQHCLELKSFLSKGQTTLTGMRTLREYMRPLPRMAAIMTRTTMAAPPIPRTNGGMVRPSGLSVSEPEEKQASLLF